MIEPAIRHTGKLPRKENYKLASYLPGLCISVTPQPNKFYRFDGIVRSIPSHIIKVLEEFGFEIQNFEEFKESLNSQKNPSAYCRHFTMNYGKGDIARFSIPFYTKLSLEENIFDLGHEDMHSIKYLDLDEAYPILNARLRKQGYDIEIQCIKDKEKQADVAGLLRVFEKRKNLSILLEVAHIKSTYEFMQNHKI